MFFFADLYDLLFLIRRGTEAKEGRMEESLLLINGLEGWRMHITYVSLGSFGWDGPRGGGLVPELSWGEGWLSAGWCP